MMGMNLCYRESFMRRIPSGVIASAFLLSVSMLSAPAAAAEETSQVLRLEIPKLVEDRYDAVVTLYHRQGKFHMGYAQLPDRDNIVHRIDVTPSPAIAFVDKNGKKIDVPEEARGSYSYKQKDFLKYKAQYYKGEIDIKHTSKVPPIQSKGKQLAGLMDLKINHVDAVNHVNRGGGSLVFRLDIKAEEKGGVLSGKAVLWQYADKDDDYGKANKKTTYAITGKWIADHWKAKAGTQYAKGKNWPMAHGPNLTGAAIDSKTPLVNTLHDARLMWVADLPLGAGRGGGLMRGDFCMYPIAWTTFWEAGYGGPIMADNKVFVYAPSPDMEAIKKHPGLARNPYYRLGADPGLLGLVPSRDSVFAFDARTGKLLWQYHGKPGSATRYGGKSGRASIPCYYSGKVYVRGGGSVICLDGETGQTVWTNGGYGLHNAPGDASVTQIGGTLVLTVQMDGGWKTVGLAPKDGAVKWSIDYAGSSGYGILGLYRENGREYVVLGRNRPDPKRKDKSKLPPETFMMVDPTDGKILWESDAMGYTDSQIVVIGDMAIGNVTGHDPKAKKPQDRHRIGGIRISTKGAKRLWVSEKVHPMPYRNMSIANHGVYYGDSRVSRFTATDIKSGKLLKSNPGIYTMSHVSHNWSWHIASNDRILTEGILMYSTADQGFEILPGRLSNAVSGGYMSPTKPAIADGRFIFRMGDKLACYDLRMHKEAAETEVINLTAEKAAVAGDRQGEVKIRIRKRGDKLISLGGKAPYLRSEDTTRAITWGPQDWAMASPWRTVIPHDLQLTDDGLKGPTRVRLGYQYEPFQIDLKRDGNQFVGTYTRSVKPLDKPAAVSGDIYGRIVSKEDGTRYFAVYLAGAVANGEKLISGEKPHAGMELIVSVDKNDQVTAVTAAAGRLNQMSHEVDVESLIVKGNTIKGKVTVITHDDRYFDVDPRPASREFRKTGEGGALALQYSFDAKGIVGKDPKTGDKRLENRGRYTETLGTAWERSGTISGELSPEAERFSSVAHVQEQ
jgi:hypothetical protein